MAQRRHKFPKPTYTLGYYVYIVRCGEFYKIGRTTRMASRITGFHVNNPYPIELIYFGECENSRTTENFLHIQFKEFLHKGEWFILNEKQINKVVKIIKKHGKGTNAEY